MLSQPQEAAQCRCGDRGRFIVSGVVIGKVPVCSPSCAKEHVLEEQEALAFSQFEVDATLGG